MVLTHFLFHLQFFSKQYSNSYFLIFQYINTFKWQIVVKAEDSIYGYAMKLVDDSILRFRDHIEAGSLGEDQFQFLSYLLSRDALTIKDVTVICLSILLDGLGTTTPSILFCLYALATDQRIQEKVFNEIKEVIGTDPK